MLSLYVKGKEMCFQDISIDKHTVQRKQVVQIKQK
jgi:hypothetical protein